jgi:hypothetical protein
MTYGADVVAIAATTSGVTGTIKVPQGAHLRNLSLGFTESANGADVVTIIELTWTGSPTPLRFTPNQWAQAIGTPAAGGQVTLVADENCMIPLDVRVEKDNLVTIKVTSTGNLATKIGLEWD